MAENTVTEHHDTQVVASIVDAAGTPVSPDTLLTALAGIDLVGVKNLADEVQARRKAANSLNYHLLVVPFDGSKPYVQTRADADLLVAAVAEKRGQKCWCIPFFGVLWSITDGPVPHLCSPAGAKFPLITADAVGTEQTIAPMSEEVKRGDLIPSGELTAAETS